MSKRILSLVLALVMVLGTFGTMVFAETELDPKVQWLIDQELLQGDGSGNYDLDKAITRDVLARIVAVALQDEESAKALQSVPSGFADMTTAHWANGYAAYANAKGYMIGNEKREFMPAGVVNYDQALVVLTKIALGRDLTAEEKAGALTWYAPYVAKANEIRLTEGVNITNVGAPAVKEDIVKMLYNVLNHRDYGNYTVLKAIVLENNRVESLKDNEIVVEVIKEIQRADFVTASRGDDDVRGEQYNFVLSDKYDVEDLLGKVADFSIDKNGNVVEVKVDDSYQYVYGEVVAIEDALKVNGKEYTVVKEERVDKTDDRLYRTYENNEAKTYRRFADARRFGDDDETVVEFARVTIKNGKVVFIDAYNFSDVAPVKDVEKDLIVYNDLRDGGDKKVSEPSMVIGFNNGKFSRLEVEDVKELDVIHLYEVGRTQFAIVRTDAAVNGTYEKVSFDRKREETLIVVDGKEYEALDVESKRPVVSYNEKDVRTLDVKYADRDLRDFKDEKVTILIDVNSNLQYIGAEIEVGEFMALVSDVLSRDVRVVRTSDEREDYRVTFGTRLYTNGDNQQSDLVSFKRGMLAYLVTDGEDLSVMAKFVDEALVKGNIKKDSDDKQLVNSNYITVDNKEYRILDRTNVFVRTTNDNGEVTGLEGTTMKAVLDDLRTPDRATGLSVEVLTDKEFERSNVTTYSRTTTTDRDDVAHTIVFTENPFKNAADTKIAKLLRIYSSGRDYEVRVEYANGEREELKVIRNSDAWKAIANEDVVIEDVVSLALTKGDDKEVRNITTKISAKAGVFEVAKEVRHTSGAIVELTDSTGKTEDYFILRNAGGFGELSAGAKVSISLAKDRTKDIDAFIVRARNTKVDGVHGEIEGQEPGEVTGVVTYINTDATRMIVKEGTVETTVAITNDTTIYTADKAVLALGTAEILAKSAQIKDEKVVEVKVVNGNLVSLRLQANFTTLNSTIDAVELLEEARYEAAGWTALQTALTAAKKVAANELATQIEVNKANSDLTTAQGALVAKNNDTTLSALKYDTTDITPINAANNVTLPFGTTTVPTVTATATEATSTVAVVQATSVTGSVVARTAVVTVTAEDGATAEYTVTFDVAAPNNDASITGITVDAVAAALDSGTTYDVELPNTVVLADLVAGDIVVTATDANATVGTATTADNGATWTVDVTAEDGTTVVTYTINVTLAP